MTGATALSLPRSLLLPVDPPLERDRRCCLRCRRRQHRGGIVRRLPSDDVGLDSGRNALARRDRGAPSGSDQNQSTRARLRGRNAGFHSLGRALQLLDTFGHEHDARGSARHRLHRRDRSRDPARPEPRGAPAPRRRARRDRSRQPLRPRHETATGPVRRRSTRSRTTTASPRRSPTGTGSGSSPRSDSFWRSRSRCADATSSTRALAAATLPFLAATIYFTFSRGAWYALVLGLIAAIAIDPRRLQLIAISLVLAPWTVFAIVAVRRQHGLVTLGASLEQATHDGHRLIPVLLWRWRDVSALAALAAGGVERYVHVPRSVRAAFAIVLVLALAVGIAGVWHREGSPETLAKRGWHAFQGLATRGSNGDVGARLTSLSADGRIPLWRVSLRDFEHAPILGQGAGTFWQSWARYRSIAE